MSARDAFQRGHIERLNALAPSLVTYPLYPYVAAWQMRGRLADMAPDEVQRFLSAQGDSLAGQRLRGDWLKQLGQKRAWDLFEREYPAFALEDVEVACYALQARLARGDLSALQEARALWFQGTAQPESCGTLFDALVTRGQLTEEDVWARVRLALEAGNVSFVKALMPYLPPAKRIAGKQLDSAARNPERYLERRPLALKTQGDRELAMFATWRVAQNPARGGGEPAGKVRHDDSGRRPRLYLGAGRHRRRAQAPRRSARLVQAHRGSPLVRSPARLESPHRPAHRRLAERVGRHRRHERSRRHSLLRGATGRRAPCSRWATPPRATRCSRRCRPSTASTASSRMRSWARGSPRFPPAIARATTKWKRRSARRACSARSSSFSSACATRARWNGAGPSAAMTTASSSPRLKWPAATAGTSAPSTRPSAPLRCTTSPCVFRLRTARW